MAEGPRRTLNAASQLATGKINVLEGGAGSAGRRAAPQLGRPRLAAVPRRTGRCWHSRAIVPDMPGWGASERPAWAREPRDIAIIVSRLIAALANLTA